MSAVGQTGCGRCTTLQHAAKIVAAFTMQSENEELQQIKDRELPVRLRPVCQLVSLYMSRYGRNLRVCYDGMKGGKVAVDVGSREGATRC